jgi:hypothetical protein
MPTLNEEGFIYIRALADRVHATLIIIDPLMAFVPDATDTYRDHHARRLLRKLSALAEETGAAVLVLRHVRKGVVVNAKDAGGGSIGFTAAARVVLLSATDPEDDTRKVLARVKGNLSAPFASLGYQLVGTGLTVKVEWLGETTHTAEQLLVQPTNTEDASELEEAKAAVFDLVAEKPVAADAAMRELKRRGIAERTWRRAKAALGVRSRKEGFSGAWSWYLPEGCQPPEGRHIDSWQPSSAAPPRTTEPVVPEECQPGNSASEGCQENPQNSEGCQDNIWGSLGAVGTLGADGTSAAADTAGGQESGSPAGDGTLRDPATDGTVPKKLRRTVLLS